MKFKVGDQILVTAGKDKGKQGKIIKVLPEKNRVVVEGINLYTKHVKPMGDRPGEKTKAERALPLANIAIINDKGQVDRIGYSLSKSGVKERIYKKTGKVIDQTKKEVKKEEKKK